MVSMKISLDHCWDCGEPLKKAARQRVKPCLCATCRGGLNNRSKGDPIKEIFNEFRKNPTTPGEDELSFESQNLIVDDEDRIIGRV
jgi:hypothetical protein